VAAAALIVALRGAFQVARKEGAPPANLRAEVAEGLRWLWCHQLPRTIALQIDGLRGRGQPVPAESSARLRRPQHMHVQVAV
jgi:hypothetical protein